MWLSLGCSPDGGFYGLLPGIYGLFLDLVTCGLVLETDDFRGVYDLFLEQMTCPSTYIHTDPQGGTMCSALSTAERGDWGLGRVTLRTVRRIHTDTFSWPSANLCLPGNFSTGMSPKMIFNSEIFLFDWKEKSLEVDQQDLLRS